MGRIRHVAFYTEDPEREAQFYCGAFDLKRLRQSENGSIWLSDGYINIALIKRSKSTGINHIGFLVDDLDSAQQRLRQIMPTAEFEMPNEMLPPQSSSSRILTATLSMCLKEAGRCKAPRFTLSIWLINGAPELSV